MKSISALFLATAFIFYAYDTTAQEMKTRRYGDFDMDKDLLLAHYDCKTDVDDLQSAAALAKLLSDSRFSNLTYHAVAG